MGKHAWANKDSRAQVTNDPKVKTLRLKGVFDYGELSVVREAWARVVPPVILDLRGAEYLDSSALGIILTIHKEQERAGFPTVLIVSETVLNTLELTRLASLFVITWTDVEAERELLKSCS